MLFINGYLVQLFKHYVLQIDEVIINNQNQYLTTYKPRVSINASIMQLTTYSIFPFVY